MEPTTSSFAALADELLIEIISQIRDRESLCSLARTSRSLQNLTEDFLWDSVLIRTGNQARHLSRLFSSGRIRVSAIHNLQIRYTHFAEDGIEDLNSVLKDLAQLRHLIVEAPCCNDSPWMDQIGKPALPWESAGRIDVRGLFKMALDSATSLRPSVLGQLQSCKFGFYPQWGNSWASTSRSHISRVQHWANTKDSVLLKRTDSLLLQTTGSSELSNI